MARQALWHGVAAIITLALLHKLDFRYGKITVLINGDEEISSPGARDTIARPGRRVLI